MPRIKEIEVFQFEELDDKAKDKARDWFRQGNDFDFEWDCIREDAKTIGLKLTAWDNGRYAQGEIISSCPEVSESILSEHGDECETYKTALKYKHDLEALDLKYPYEDIEDRDLKYDDEREELDSEFLKSLLEDYRIILDKQHDYINSDEAVDENILANEYEFTKEGKRA